MPKLILAFGAASLITMAAVALWLDPAAEKSDFPDRSAEKIDLTAGTIYSTRFADVDGNEQILGQWQHRLLVINFWATWCTPCKEEMPMFAKMQGKYGKDGLQIVGIAVDSRENVVKFIQNSPVGYPLLPDEARAIEFSKRLGNRLGLLPFTVAFRPGGELIFSRMGLIKEQEMDKLVAKNLPK